MKLVSDTDPILRQLCDPVDFSKPIDFEKLIFDMKLVMITNNGIGLAAPQVGLLDQIFIIGEGDNILPVLNPEIIEYSKEKVVELEGCLSFPKLRLKITRSENIMVRYQNHIGGIFERKLEGIWARCFQHENDHLHGLCFINRVSKLKLDMAKKKLLKK